MFYINVFKIVRLIMESTLKPIKRRSRSMEMPKKSNAVYGMPAEGNPTGKLSRLIGIWQGVTVNS
jgi:hypothetical protein